MKQPIEQLIRNALIEVLKLDKETLTGLTKNPTY